MVCLTTRFYVALCLFWNRSQMMSKCVKNKEVAHEPQTYIYRDHFFFGVTDVFTKFWRLLWSTEQTHDNMESICFIQWTERKKKTSLPCTTWMFNDLCQFSHFFSHTCYFSFFCFFFLLCLTCEQFLRKVFHCLRGWGGSLKEFFGWGYAVYTRLNSPNPAPPPIQGMLKPMSDCLGQVEI